MCLFSGEHSAARLQIKLSRELRGYLLESYLPSSLFVIISWGSFCVIPEIVPGRMVLLVTTLLSLVTMFDTVRCVFDVSIIKILTTYPIITLVWALILYLYCFTIKSLLEILFLFYLLKEQCITYHRQQ